jgi:hypothetical protein
MIWHDVKQDSTEWLFLRAGRPTASEFKKILTPGGKLSTSSDGYMSVKLYEWMVGVPFLDREPTKWMSRGTELEPQAIANYTLQTGNEVIPGGFYMTDDSLVGASPDGNVGDSALLECKCMTPPGHVLHMILGFDDREYRPQTQGQLYVAERDYGDLISHCPELPPVIVRKGRDEAYIGLLKDALNQFCETMLQRREELSTRYGPFPLPKSMPADSPDNPFGVSMDDADRIIAGWEQ